MTVNIIEPHPKGSNILPGLAHYYRKAICRNPSGCIYPLALSEIIKKNTNPITYGAVFKRELK